MVHANTCKACAFLHGISLNFKHSCQALGQVLGSNQSLCASGVAARQPARPRLAQLLCFVFIHSQNAASLEATLQEQHAVAPQGLKATPTHCPPWLLWMHPCLHQNTLLHYNLLYYNLKNCMYYTVYSVSCYTMITLLDTVIRCQYLARGMLQYYRVQLGMLTSVQCW